MNRETLSALINQGDIQAIFRNLGWEAATDDPQLQTTFAGREESLDARIVAQKRGFVVCVARPDAMPSKAMRKRWQTRLSKRHYENMLIFIAADGAQRWMIEIQPPDRPPRSVEVAYPGHGEPGLLMEKLNGLAFGIREEGGLGIIDVHERVHQSMGRNAEAVTRRFYREFRDKLQEFQGFIAGLQEQVDQEQYAALMLNRLMFIYFIQSKGFLDGDRNYLRTRLERHREQANGDSFYRSFYRHFLMTLFHSGLGAPEQSRTAEVRARIGRIPYLNGGLFDSHQLEQQYRQDLDIDDQAFDKIFAFFDQYRWHLDDTPTASGRDINPDVIGYIFEKYINDRARMGAYYTREDITGYIARNTILPHLLRRARQGCREAFDAGNTGTIWQLLRENPDHYIHNAVRHGGDLPDSDLPPDIARGLDAEAPDLLARRAQWNQAAPKEWALPTETWREALTRRARYHSLRQRLQDGRITTIADLTTENLNLERLCLDFIRRHDGSDLITAFYTAIAGRPRQEGTNAAERRGITVLDPACGSGAFLFAALNVLQPLYDACISRMQEFVEEDDLLHDGQGRRHKFFRAVLEDMEKHISAEYWIYRSIILKNLFGVDIMAEAAEVAKLRLFLKLAAVAEADPDKPNMGLEPLPDIDFNIRSGNSLVGLTSLDDFTTLDLSGQKDRIVEQAKTVGLARKRFVDKQVTSDANDDSFRASKRELQEKLTELNQTLSEHLHHEYDPKNDKDPQKFAEWQRSHQPFHWCAEFYEIIADGGFDVIIGNPPYVKIKDIPYGLRAGQFNCPDIYGHMVRAAFNIASRQGMVGLVVMHNLAFSKDFGPTRKLICDKAKQTWYSWYGRIPSGLFTHDTRVRCGIFISRMGSGDKCWTTRLHRWTAAERPSLFGLLQYTSLRQDAAVNVLPMLNSRAENDFFTSLAGPAVAFMMGVTGHPLYFKKTAYNYISISPEPPPCFDEQGNPIESTKTGVLNFPVEENRDAMMLLFGGRMFFTNWLVFGDDFDVKKSELRNFMFAMDALGPADKQAIHEIAREYRQAIASVLQFKTNAGKGIGSYNTSKLWHITDKSDIVFLRRMTDRPELVAESMRHHILQTVKT